MWTCDDKSECANASSYELLCCEGNWDAWNRNFRVTSYSYQRACVYTNDLKGSECLVSDWD